MAARVGTSLVTLLIFVVGLAFLGSQAQTPDPRQQGSAAQRLHPVRTEVFEPSIRRTVYVPVYSSIYLGLDIKKKMVELASTVSVRNVSSRHPLVLESVRYYDSAGNRVRDYLDVRSQLLPLATVEFVIQRADVSGGPGANLLIQWAGPSDVDEPVIEAVMVGQSGNAGISFTSSGRVVKNEPRLD